MKKIIFVSGIQIFPPESGGQLRSANLCLALAKLGHKVEIYSFTGRKKDYLAFKKSDLVQINESLIEYVNRNPLWGFLQFLFYKFELPPLWLSWVTRFYCPKKLEEMLSNASSLFLDFPFLYPLGKKRELSLIINTHNAEFELYSKNTFLSNLVKKIETAAFHSASQILFCSNLDQNKFSNHVLNLNKKATQIPNGILLEHFVFDPEKRKEMRRRFNISDQHTVFLFTGSKYLPNVRAYNFLVQWAHEHADELLAEKMIIMIVGTVSEVLVDLPYLKVAGKVPEIHSYFWGSDFGLNTIEDGSGTNVKMIEYMAARLPIVTTTFGARGVNLIDQETCLFFERDNLNSVLKTAKEMNESQKILMAQKAFHSNQKNIDMVHALSTLVAEGHF